MSATTGKVALVSNSQSLYGTNTSGVSIIDFVGYGNTNAYEGTGSVGQLSATSSAVRILNNGVWDNNNSKE